MHEHGSPLVCCDARNCETIFGIGFEFFQNKYAVTEMLSIENYIPEDNTGIDRARNFGK